MLVPKRGYRVSLSCRFVHLPLTRAERRTCKQLRPSVKWETLGWMRLRFSNRPRPKDRCLWVLEAC